MKIYVLLLMVLISIGGYAQKMYETDLSNCPLKFVMEDTEQFIIYEPNDSVMVSDFLIGLEEKQVSKMKGIVMAQVMIDTAFNVCLVSYTNKTNLSDRKLDLENRLQQMPGWKRIAPGQEKTNICALITIGFDAKQYTIQRTGYNRNNGRKVLERNFYKRVADTVPIISEP